MNINMEIHKKRLCIFTKKLLIGVEFLKSKNYINFAVNF